MVSNYQLDEDVVNFSNGSGSQVPIHRDRDHQRCRLLCL
jgi:hypothetical protein